MFARVLAFARGGPPWRVGESSTKPTRMCTHPGDGKGDPASKDTSERFLARIALENVIAYSLRAQRACREPVKQHRHYELT